MADEIRTITLSKPIQAHGETVSTLTLRRPTVAELRQYGQPYAIVPSSGGIKADYQVCAGLISTICAIPPSSVDMIDSADFDDMAVILVGFMRRARVAASDTGSGATS